MNRQKYKEKVILLEHDIRKNKEFETDQHQLQHQLQDPPPLPARSPIANFVNAWSPVLGSYFLKVIYYLLLATYSMI